ncbi:MAG: trypsin-like peptidase domain-containing protein [Clostridiales bacterium]|jgi:serine protease Do|nr:trypsin-like peptidase domain-containing protein [Clostridiales bacterium]
MTYFEDEFDGERPGEQREETPSGELVYAPASAEPPEPEPFYKETVKRDGDKRRSQTFKRALALVVVAALIAAPSFGFSVGFGQRVAEAILPGALAAAPEPDPTAVPVVSGDIFKQSSSVVSDTAAQPRVGYAAIIDNVEPSVVSIVSTVEGGGYGGYGGFGDYFGGRSTGLGSGILFHENDQKYYIVTNYHVVQDASGVSVSISGCEPIPAAIVGFDSAQDLAVASVAKADAREAGVETAVIAEFGNSDGLRVGDEVLAIGNALGEGNTATNGIVSAMNKEISVEGRDLVVLQTNAAINPGNSGGPLINLSGKVIGINTAKIEQTDTEGMGYSIPSNIAQPIIQSIMDSINKPYLGVTVSTINDETAKQYNLPSAGAFVSGVVDGSPADKAGIEENDVITGFNGMPILTSEQLTQEVRGCEIGDEVEVKLIRGKGNLTIMVKLEARQ